MDCREFRNKHVAFVDDVLPAVDMRAMQQHRSICSRCSRHDTAIRRSLLLVRNLPPITPSADFMARLNQRLEQMDPSSHVDYIVARRQVPSMAALAALAVGAVMVGYLALETTRYFAPPGEMKATPVVATLPALDPTPSPIANASFVASVPTGMPVWPAVLMLGQASMRFANLDLHDAELER